MAITTKNTNPRNDSKWARHRSVTKGNQKQLEDVMAALRAQPGAHYRHFFGTPSEIRDSWRTKFGQGLPAFNSEPQNFKGTAGLGEWLGAGPVAADLPTIWADFFKIFVRRSDDKDTTVQTLFVSYTNTNLDLIYSKWGTTPGHNFFHWAATAAAAPRRATIDDFDNADDAGADENNM